MDVGITAQYVTLNLTLPLWCKKNVSNLFVFQISIDKHESNSYWIDREATIHSS